MKSLILDKINQFFATAQKYSAPLRENSSIIKNIEDVEFILISMLLVLSTVSNSDILGYFAIGVIFISFIKPIW